VDKEPGETYCEEGVTQRCGTDRVTSELVEECESYCDEDGAECSTDEACPAVSSENLYDCTGVCGGSDEHCAVSEFTQCNYLDLTNASASKYIRLPRGAEQCPLQDCEQETYLVLFKYRDVLHVDLPEGWSGLFYYDEIDPEDIQRVRACYEPMMSGCVGASVDVDPQSPYMSLILRAESDAPATTIRLETGSCGN
jgi:hypothetical protein